MNDSRLALKADREFYLVAQVNFDALLAFADIFAFEVKRTDFACFVEMGSAAGHLGEAFDFPVTPLIFLVAKGADNVVIGLNQGIGFFLNKWKGFGDIFTPFEVDAFIADGRCVGFLSCFARQKGLWQWAQMLVSG